MAVTKIWSVKDSISRLLNYCSDPEKTKRSDLEALLKYASDGEKVFAENEKLHAVTGINCNAETAFEEMRDVQERFGKTGGNVAYHAYQSFKTGELGAELCHKLGVELAQKMWGDKYQVLVATHYNTGTYHNHFVLNAVSLLDGKKYDCSKREYYRMRRLSDEMCAREGLTVIEDPGKRTPRSVWLAEKRGEPTKYNLMRKAIDKAVSMSTDQNAFIYAMKKQGYIVDMASFTRRYPTIRSVNAKQATRLWRLGEDYDKGAIIDRIDRNRMYHYDETENRFELFSVQFETEGIREKPPDPKYYFRRIFYDADIMHASPIELYLMLWVFVLDLTVETLHFAFDLIRYEAKIHEAIRRAELVAKSPELREAARFAERYQAQLIVMSEGKLRTPDEVRDYIAGCELKIAEVQGYREHWRNRLRRETDPKEIERLKAERDKCTRLLKHLRSRKEAAQTVIDDTEKVRHMLICEQNVQRGTDPYELARGYKLRDVKQTERSISR